MFKIFTVVSLHRRIHCKKANIFSLGHLKGCTMETFEIIRLPYHIWWKHEDFFFQDVDLGLKSFLETSGLQRFSKLVQTIQCYPSHQILTNQGNYIFQKQTKNRNETGSNLNLGTRLTALPKHLGHKRCCDITPHRCLEVCRLTIFASHCNQNASSFSKYRGFWWDPRA